MAVSTTGFRCMSDSTAAAATAAAAAAAAAITSNSTSASAVGMMCPPYNSIDGGADFSTSCNPFLHSTRGNYQSHSSGNEHSLTIASAHPHGQQDSRMAEKIVSELQVSKDVELGIVKIIIIQKYI